MSALAELQRSLQRHVLDRDDGSTDAAQNVVASAAASAAERLGVYRHAYRARLLEVLRNDFPGLRALAGNADFDALCSHYIEATPSPHFNVRWYGDGLAGYTGTVAPWCAQPAVAAMATLEWTMGLSFDAPAQAVVAFVEVVAVAPQDWPRMRLVLHPSLRRLTLGWNVTAIRRALDHDEPAPTLQAWEPAQRWVVWRRDSGVRYRRLEDDEAAALDAVSSGATFAELCERLCEWHAVDAVAPRAAQFFRAWIEEQWVSELQLADG